VTRVERGGRNLDAIPSMAGVMAAKTEPCGPVLSLATCRRRLAPWGLRVDGPGTAGTFSVSSARRSVRAEGQISWHGPAALKPTNAGSEATVQARSGLMGVHGRDAGHPRRIGVEVASVAAGVLAAHGVLAGLIGRARGFPESTVEVSPLQAALLLGSHYLTAATATEPDLPVLGGPDPGPPFRSADGRWFEIETLDPESWRSFWWRLGAGGADLGRAWTAFRRRYFDGRCSLPTGLQDATARHTLEELVAVAAEFRVSLCPIRGYDEVLADLGPWAGHPDLEPLSGVAARGPAPLGAPPTGLPLEGLVVAESTTRLQGPLAGLLLQSLGAEVVKVEPPGGDIGRGVPPLTNGTGSFFLAFNHGKQSQEIDLASRGGRAELLELLGGADVFLHNWRPGKAAAWGLDAADVARVNPGLVYVQASGWGSQAAEQRWVGTDFLVQGFSALGHRINPQGEVPAPSRVLLTDFMGALVACEGALAGLYLRELDGKGQRVGTSLLAGGMALHAHILGALASGEQPGPARGRPVWDILDRPLPTPDGALAVSVDDDASLALLCEACGVKGGRREEAASAVAEAIAGTPAAEWEELLAGTGLAAAAVATDLAALPADPRLAGLFEPLGAGGWAPASPWRWEG